MILLSVDKCYEGAHNLDAAEAHHSVGESEFSVREIYYAKFTIYNWVKWDSFADNWYALSKHMHIGYRQSIDGFLMPAISLPSRGSEEGVSSET